jgi:hypothetical protein
VSTEIDQTYTSESTPEVHQGAAYWVVGTRSFDEHGIFSLTSQGYVSPQHEDLAFPAMAAEGFPWQDGGNGGAIMAFTLTGNGGPTGADNGGFYPSTAFARLTSTSSGVVGNVQQFAGLGRRETPQRYQAEPAWMLGNVLRCDTTLPSMRARLSTTGAADPLTRPGSRLSSLRNSAWMAAEGSWTSGAVPVSSPYDWPTCSRVPSALTPIRR